MAQLQNEILSIQEYFRSVEYYGKHIVVKVEFPKRWHVYSSLDEKIKAIPDDNIPNVFFYFTDINEASLEDVFDLIRETIDTNVNALKKVEMMKERMNELKELFSTHSIEELKGLKFVLEESKPKTKRKYNRKKKADSVSSTEEPVDNAIVETEGIENPNND